MHIVPAGSTERRDNMKKFLKELVFPLILNGLNLFIFGFYLATHTLYLSWVLLFLDYLGIKACVALLREEGATVTNIISLFLCILAALGGIGITVLWFLILVSR